MYETLQKWQKSNGISNQLLSKKLGHEVKWISDLYRGHGSMQVKDVLNVKKITGINIETLLEECKMRKSFLLIHQDKNKNYIIDRILSVEDADELVHKLGYNTVSGYLSSSDVHLINGKYMLIENE